MSPGHPGMLARVREEGERLLVCSPAVGLWRGMPEAGAWITPGGALGSVESLGLAQPLVLPPRVGGRVTERTGAGRSAVPVAFGEVLLVLEPTGSIATALAAAPGSEAAAASGLVFAAPMSGRFYGRPGPGKEPFVREGDVISVGHTLGLLEVMKTFNRVAYGGAGLPDPARVVRLFPDEGADLGAGDPIVEVEPA